VTSSTVAPALSARDLLADLDAEQREAVEITRGPLCILAGAGSGKTRVISRRVAYAIATGAVEARHVLVVTFTDKAATEMRERIGGLGEPAVATGTFHATAFKQLRFFWPLLSDRPLPEVLPTKLALIAPLQQRLPGGYRFFAARDLAQEIEWAKARRLTPATYATGAASAGHEGPLPPELMTQLFGRYEAAKQRAGRIDFEDMLAMTVGLLEDNPDALEQVRSRHRWLSVDEYQDTNALQQSLLDLWLGDRDDLAVVGDVDQTIYSFTGASSEFLTGFANRFPNARVVHLVRNYRSTPQVLDVANRLLADGAPSDGRPKRLIATLPPGLLPMIRAFGDAEAEAAAVVREIQHRLDTGVAAGEIAILVRTNAQLPEYETALRGAGGPVPDRRRAVLRATRRARRDARRGGRECQRPWRWR
jgi:DNA helicase-2/ATP-dependent DNA helicase PcrA